MRYIITILIVLVIGIGAFLLLSGGDGSDFDFNNGATTTDQADMDDSATTTDEAGDASEAIGSSVEGRDITARHFGSGDTEILLVGGIHGGYSWNTALLGYQIVDWLEENPNAVPSGVQVTVIPVLNPDGLAATVGTASGNFSASDVPSDTTSGRFNANGVDLNRNFDCNWQSQGRWQSRTVDAGSSAFSEPETQALRDYVQSNNPDAAVVYYSAAGGVYSASCNSGVLSATTELMNTYANASGYSAEGEFTAYEITGDAVDWMAKIGIPGISVLLETHNQVEWTQNRQGLQAVFEAYADQ